MGGELEAERSNTIQQTQSHTEWRHNYEQQFGRSMKELQEAEEGRGKLIQEEVEELRKKKAAVVKEAEAKLAEKRKTIGLLEAVLNLPEIAKKATISKLEL